MGLGVSAISAKRTFRLAVLLAAPAFANTAKTLFQTAAVLVTAGATADQASAALHSLAVRKLCDRLR